MKKQELIRIEALDMNGQVVHEEEIEWKLTKKGTLVLDKEVQYRVSEYAHAANVAYRHRGHGHRWYVVHFLPTVNAAGEINYSVTEWTENHGPSLLQVKMTLPMALATKVAEVQASAGKRQSDQCEIERRSRCRLEYCDEAIRQWVDSKSQFVNYPCSFKSEEEAVLAAKTFYKAITQYEATEKKALLLWPELLSDACLGDAGGFGELIIECSEITCE